MTRKLLFLINPVSGTADKSFLKETIRAKCEAAGIAFHIFPTEKDGHYPWLAEKVTGESFTDVIACGGDGTISQVAAALRNIDVNIGVVPMGSGNGLAFAARIPSAVDGAVDIILKGKASFIDAFLINGRFSCMLCGIGFDAQVAYDFSLQGKRGLYTYIKVTINNYFKAISYPFEIIHDNLEIKGDCYFISIANSNQFGNNFTIAPQASLSDGLLDIIVVRKMHKVKMIFSILSHMKFGRVLPVEDHDKSSILYFKSKKLKVLNPAKAPFHMDGEPVETSNEFNIEIIENAFRLLQP